MYLTRITPTATSLHFSGFEILVSYQTPVAVNLHQDTKFNHGDQTIKAGIYKTDRFWSVTTSTHINRWAGYKVEDTIPQECLNELYSKIG